MTKVLPTVWLTLGDRSIASTRVRAMAMSEALTRRGVASTCIRASGVLGRLRAIALLSMPRRQVVVVQKLLFGRLMLRFLRWRARVLVWECDDALHLGYPGATETTRTRALVQDVLARADLVTTTTPLLAKDLIPASGRVLDFVGPAPARSTPRREPDGPMLVWLGSLSTSANLDLLGNTPKVLRADGWDCVAVGAAGEAERFGWRVVPWSETAQFLMLERATVGVLPQRADAWSDRKAAYKILEYAAHDVVPVASDVYPARFVLGESLAELLVAEDEPWEDQIRDAHLRRRQLLRAVEELAAVHGADRCIDAWIRAVGELGGVA